MVDTKKKEEKEGDKEAPIDPENVNNPTEPMRIEERVRKKKKKKKTERRNPAGHCSTGIVKGLSRDFSVLREWILKVREVDLSDGQFSERCDVDGSFFNSDAIQILFEKA